jgi:hypothetical protein
MNVQLNNWYSNMKKHALDSLQVNYYYNILLILIIWIYSKFSKFSFFIIFLNLIIFINFSYFYHRWTHHISSYLLTYGHIYHHYNSSNLFSILLENIWEIIFLFFLLFLKLIVKLEYNIELWIDELFIIFCALVWGSIHQINYSIFHVNTIHEKQHKNVNTNYGLEIADIFYGTKYDDEVEDFGHFFINIIVITILLIFFKRYFENISPWLFIYFYMSILVISLLINVILCSKDLNEHLKQTTEVFFK